MQAREIYWDKAESGFLLELNNRDCGDKSDWFDLYI